MLDVAFSALYHVGMYVNSINLGKECFFKKKRLDYQQLILEH